MEWDKKIPLGNGLATKTQRHKKISKQNYLDIKRAGLALEKGFFGFFLPLRLKKPLLCV